MRCSVAKQSRRRRTDCPACLGRDPASEIATNYRPRVGAACRYQLVVNSFPLREAIESSHLQPAGSAGLRSNHYGETQRTSRQHGGRSDLESPSARIASFQVVLENDATQCGIATSAWFELPPPWSDVRSRTRADGPVFCHDPPFSATFTGWYSSVFKPCGSPKKPFAQAREWPPCPGHSPHGAIPFLNFPSAGSEHRPPARRRMSSVRCGHHVGERGRGSSDWRSLKPVNRDGDSVLA